MWLVTTLKQAYDLSGINLEKRIGSVKIMRCSTRFGVSIFSFPTGRQAEAHKIKKRISIWIRNNRRDGTKNTKKQKYTHEGPRLHSVVEDTNDEIQKHGLVDMGMISICSRVTTVERTTLISSVGLRRVACMLTLTSSSVFFDFVD